MDSSFTIWRAIFYSMLAHGVVFSASIPMITERSDRSNMVRLEARLNPGSAQEGMATVSPEVSKEATEAMALSPEVPPMQDTRRDTRLEEKSAPKPNRTALPKADVPVSEAIAVSVPEAVAVSAPEAVAVSAPEAAAAFDTASAGGGANHFASGEHMESGDQLETGIEEYKWALTRAMKGARQYPSTARMQGITGKVTTRVVWLPTFTAPRVELAASSGSRLLDEDALAKFGRAVLVTPLPETLRNRSFELSQTVDYSLE